MKKFVPIFKAALVLVLVVSLALAAKSKWDRQTGIRTYEEARAMAWLKTEGGTRRPQAEASGQPAPEEPVDPLTRLAQTDLAALREINPDVIGWIEIPGTELSYPLVQGRDNEYYLNRTWDKTRNVAGSIFMDYTCSPELNRFHTILYGHRMNDDTMFGVLKHYKDSAFWQEHPEIYIAAEDGLYRYEIFAAQEADVKGIVYRLDLVASHLQAEFLQTCLRNSVLTTDVVPETDNRILTLSTCTGYSQSTRWVVHGVLAQIYDYEDILAEPAE